ncbi:hypothetical protein BDV95DRAFT_120334 [Massariosphaeria phaeospora]|uniref:Uncharacterized protein n=1 Tax=Massariosphaeria phaeospora TaxID=100035 RepID=A0A7C8I1Y7_9PLEO|nr:hypothetical protein BDV95DRAFT_120334 [Massariosphaeria phaeospora]
MIGQECLGAITTSVDANGNATFFDESNYNSLSECNLGSSMMTTLATTDPAMSGAANCGPTNTDNDKGQSSLLFTFVNASSDANADDFAPYDLMAKKAYFMSVVEWRANDTGKGGKQAYFVCLKNTDFSEGARNPEPAQNQPPSQPSGSVSPTPTPPKGSAITFTASGMVWAAAMGAFLVFV